MVVMAYQDLLCDPETVAATAAHHYGQPLTNKDPVVLEACRVATARFRSAIGHHLTQQLDLSLTLDGNGTRVLRLPVLRPVIRAVRVDGDEVTGWHVSGAGLLGLQHPTPRRYGVVVVDVDRCGLVDIPEEVRAVVTQQAVMGVGQSPGVQTMTVGSMSLTFGSTSALGVAETWATAVEAWRIRQGDRA